MDPGDYGDWLRVLGLQSSGCENIRDHVKEVRRVLDTSGPLLQIMVPEALTAYSALPDQILVYRGCSAGQFTGLSWSLDRDCAQIFATFPKYAVADPVLVTAVTRKRDVLALILEREEQDIVTFKARRQLVEPILGGDSLR